MCTYNGGLIVLPGWHRKGRMPLLHFSLLRLRLRLGLFSLYFFTQLKYNNGLREKFMSARLLAHSKLLNLDQSFPCSLIASCVKVFKSTVIIEFLSAATISIMYGYYNGYARAYSSLHAHRQIPSQTQALHRISRFCS
jgi:hypothetical protein